MMKSSTTKFQALAKTDGWRHPFQGSCNLPNGQQNWSQQHRKPEELKMVQMVTS